MNKENETTLRTWSAPHLMRLNQADGTEKHLTLAEGSIGFGQVYGYPSTAPVGGICTASANGSGGGNACGPS